MENEEKILKELLTPKTIDEIVKKTGIQKEEIEKYIRKLKEEGLLKENKGKYVLIDLVIDMVEENYYIDIIFTLEIYGNNKENVNKAMEYLEKRLKEDPNIGIIMLEKLEPIKEGDQYIGSYEARLGFFTLNEVIYFILNYGPSSILEVIKPNELKLNKEQILDFLIEMTVASNQYLNIIRELINENNRLKKQIKVDKNENN